MDLGDNDIPTGRHISRTPVSEGGEKRMNAAAAVAATAAVSQNPGIEGIREQPGSASLVGQGSDGGGGGQDPSTPVLPKSGSLLLTTQLEEVLSKIRGKCGQNRVLWEDVHKAKLLPQEFLDSEYDEDVLFLPTLGCPDVSVPELNELAQWCSDASGKLEVLAGTSVVSAVEGHPKLQLTAKVSLYNVDCLGELAKCRINLANCIGKAKQLGQKCLQISQELCMIDEQARVANAIFRNKLLLPLKVNKDRNQAQLAMSILHRHVEDPLCFINQINENVTKLDSYIAMARDCESYYKTQSNLVRPKNSSMDSSFPDEYKNQVWLSICHDSPSWTKSHGLEVSYDRNCGSNLDQKFFQVFDEVTNIRIRDQSASRVLLRAFDMKFLNNNRNIPVTVVSLTADQIAQYYIKIKQYLEVIISKPWVTDLKRESQWVSAVIKKADSNIQKVEESLTDKNTVEVQQLKRQCLESQLQSFQEVIDRIEQDSIKVNIDHEMVLKQARECICDKCNEMLSLNSQEGGLCDGCGEAVLVTNLYRPVEKSVIDSSDKRPGMTTDTLQFDLPLPDINSIQISSWKPRDIVVGSSGARNVHDGVGSACYKQLGVIEENSSQGTQVRSLQYTRTDDIMGYSPSNCRAKNQATLHEVLSNNKQPTDLKGLRPNYSFDKSILAGVHKNIIESSTLENTPQNSGIWRRTNLAKQLSDSHSQHNFEPGKQAQGEVFIESFNAQQQGSGTSAASAAGMNLGSTTGANNGNTGGQSQQGAGGYAANNHGMPNNNGSFNASNNGGGGAGGPPGGFSGYNHGQGHYQHSAGSRGPPGPQGPPGSAPPWPPDPPGNGPAQGSGDKELDRARASITALTRLLQERTVAARQFLIQNDLQTMAGMNFTQMVAEDKLTSLSEIIISRLSQIQLELAKLITKGDDLMLAPEAVIYSTMLIREQAWLQQTMSGAADVVNELDAVQRARIERIKSAGDITRLQNRAIMDTIAFGKIVKFDPKSHVFISWSRDFSDEMSRITDPKLKYKKLADSLNHIPYFRTFLQMYDPAEFEECFKQLILRFGDRRSSQQDLTKLIAQLPVQCKTMYEELKLFDCARYILLQTKKFPKIFSGYLTDIYFNRNIFARLTPERKEKFMHEYQEHVEKQDPSIPIKPTYMDFFFLYWAEGLASQMREIQSINKDLYYDPLKTTIKPKTPEKKFAPTTKVGGPPDGKKPGGGGGADAKKKQFKKNKYEKKKSLATSQIDHQSQGSAGKTPCKLCGDLKCKRICTKIIFAKKNGDHKDKLQAVLKANFCPACLTVVGDKKSHECLKARERKKPDGSTELIDLTAFQCKLHKCDSFGWKGRAINKYLCDCEPKPRPKQACPLALHSISILALDSESFKEGYCPEEVVQVRLPNGNIDQALISYDTMASSTMSNTQTAEECAREQQQTTFTLVTALGNQEVTGLTGLVDILDNKGKERAQVRIFSIPSTPGSTSILDRNHLEEIKKLPSPYDKYLKSRAEKSAKYRLVIGATDRHLLPSEVIIESSDKSFALFRSKITGKAIPFGRLPDKGADGKCKQACPLGKSKDDVDVGEEVMDDDQDLVGELICRGQLDAGDAQQVETASSPPLFGEPHNNQFYSDGVGTVRKLADPSRGLVGSSEPEKRTWFPKLEIDPYSGQSAEHGDNVCMYFHQKTGGEIKSILKKNDNGISNSVKNVTFSNENFVLNIPKVGLGVPTSRLKRCRGSFRKNLDSSMQRDTAVIGGNLSMAINDKINSNQLKSIDGLYCVTPEVDEPAPADGEQGDEVIAPDGVAKKTCAAISKSSNLMLWYKQLCVLMVDRMSSGNKENPKDDLCSSTGIADGDDDQASNCQSFCAETDVKTASCAAAGKINGQEKIACAVDVKSIDPGNCQTKGVVRSTSSMEQDINQTDTIVDDTIGAGVEGQDDLQLCESCRSCEQNCWKKVSKKLCGSTSFKIYSEQPPVQISERDRIQLLNDNCAYIAEDKSARLCNKCSECACARHPQNSLKDRLLSVACEDAMELNKAGNRWITDFVPNSGYELLDPVEGDRKAFGRFKAVYEQASRAGAWSMVRQKFLKEVSNGNIITFDQFAKEYPDVVEKETPGNMILSWAWKDLPEGVESCESRTGSGIRLVGNQSLKVNDNLDLNSSLEYGNAKLASLFDAVTSFNTAPLTAIGDLKSAYFSIEQSPRLQYRSLFYFSTQESGPFDKSQVKLYVHRALVMGLSQSGNCLGNAIAKTLGDTKRRSTLYHLPASLFYCDDGIVVSSGRHFRADGSKVHPLVELLEKCCDLYRCLSSVSLIIPEFYIANVGTVRFSDAPDRPEVHVEVQNIIDQIRNKAGIIQEERENLPVTESRLPTRPADWGASKLVGNQHDQADPSVSKNSTMPATGQMDTGVSKNSYDCVGPGTDHEVPVESYDQLMNEFGIESSNGGFSLPRPKKAELYLPVKSQIDQQHADVCKWSREAFKVDDGQAHLKPINEVNKITRANNECNDKYMSGQHYIDGTIREHGVLGVRWIVGLGVDSLSWSANINPNPKKLRGKKVGRRLSEDEVEDYFRNLAHPDRRAVASVSACIFDPTGRFLPTQNRFKALNTKSLAWYAKNKGEQWKWSDPLPLEYLDEFISCVMEIFKITRHRESRYRGPSCNLNLNMYDVSLVSCSDGSTCFASHTQYLVYTPLNIDTAPNVLQQAASAEQCWSAPLLRGKFCQRVSSKSKSVPHNASLTIPSTELASLLLSGRFSDYFMEVLSPIFGNIPRICLADSMTVLALARAPLYSYGLKSHVLRRGLEVQGLQQKKVLRYCPGSCLIADMTSKIHKNGLAMCLSDICNQGIFFMKAKRHWPILDNSDAICTKSVLEILSIQPAFFSDNLGQRRRMEGKEIVPTLEDRVDKNGLPKVSELLRVPPPSTKGLFCSRITEIVHGRIAVGASGIKLEDCDVMYEGQRPSVNSHNPVHELNSLGEYYCNILPTQTTVESAALDKAVTLCAAGINIETGSTDPAEQENGTLGTSYSDTTQPQLAGEKTGGGLGPPGAEQLKMLKMDDKDKPKPDNECWRPAESHQGEFYDLSHMNRPGYQFVNQELMSNDLERTARVDRLLFNVSLAVALFTQKLGRFKHLVNNVQSVKFQLFHRIIASLFGVISNYIKKDKKLKKRCYEHQKLWFSVNRLATGIRNSTERIVLCPASALFLAVLRSIHATNHLRSPEDNLARFELFFVCEGALRYLTWLQDHCAVCKILRAQELVRQKNRKVGPFCDTAFTKRSRTTLVWEQVSVDWFGPYSHGNCVQIPKKGKFWVVVFCDMLSKAVSLHLAVDYSAKTFKDILCHFASIHGIPIKIKCDAQAAMLTTLAEIGSMTNKTFQSNYARKFLKKYKLTVKVAQELSSLGEMSREEREKYVAENDIPRSKEMLCDFRRVADYYGSDIDVACVGSHQSLGLCERTGGLVENTIDIALNKFGPVYKTKLSILTILRILSHTALYLNQRPLYYSASAAAGQRVISPASFQMTNVYHNIEFQRHQRYKLLDSKHSKLKSQLSQQLLDLEKRLARSHRRFLMKNKLDNNDLYKFERTLPSGSIVFVLSRNDKFKSTLQIGRVLGSWVDPDKDCRRYAVHTTVVDTKNSTARELKYRDSVLMRAATSLSYPIVEAHQIDVLKSKYYSTASFYIKYGKFLEKEKYGKEIDESDSHLLMDDWESVLPSLGGQDFQLNELPFKAEMLTLGSFDWSQYIRQVLPSMPPGKSRVNTEIVQGDPKKCEINSDITEQHLDIIDGLVEDDQQTLVEDDCEPIENDLVVREDDQPVGNIQDLPGNQTLAKDNLQQAMVKGGTKTSKYSKNDLGVKEDDLKTVGDVQDFPGNGQVFPGNGGNSVSQTSKHSKNDLGVKEDDLKTVGDVQDFPGNGQIFPGNGGNSVSQSSLITDSAEIQQILDKRKLFPLHQFGRLQQDAGDNVAGPALLISGHRRLNQIRLPQRGDILEVFLNNQSDDGVLCKVKSLCPKRYQKKPGEIWVNLAYSGEVKPSFALLAKFGSPDWSIIREEHVQRSTRANTRRLGKLAAMSQMLLLLMLVFNPGCVDASDDAGRHVRGNKSAVTERPGYQPSTLTRHNSASQKLENRICYQNNIQESLTDIFGPKWYQTERSTEIEQIKWILWGYGVWHGTRMALDQNSVRKRVRRQFISVSPNFEFHVAGNADFALAKYHSQIHNNQPFFGTYKNQFLDYSDALSEPGVTQEQSLEARGKVCRYYIDLICSLNELKSGQLYNTAPKLTAKLTGENEFDGGSLIPSTYSSADGGNDGRHNTMYTSSGNYEPPARPELPSPDPEPADRASHVEVPTCGRYALMSDSIERVSRYLFEYERILQIWAGSELAVDGYLPDSHNLGTRNFLVRAGGDLLWSEEDTKNPNKYIDLNPVVSWTLQDIQSRCAYRGGTLAAPSTPALRFAIRNICIKLKCQFILVKLRSSGGGLFFSETGTGIPNDLAQQWQSIYYNSSDTSVQTDFNNSPWLLITFHEENAFSDFWMLQKTNKLVFPLPLSSRALCVFKDTHPVSRASELLLRYNDDINEELPSRNEEVQGQIAEITRVVNEFNERQTQKMVEDHVVDCEQSRIEIAEEDRLVREIEEGLSLSHSELNHIVRRLGPLYERVSFTKTGQDAIYDKQLALGPDLDKLEEFLKKYLIIAGRWTELISDVYYSLPANASYIGVNEHFANFGESFELVILAVVSAIALMSLCLNMALLCCVTVVQSLNRRGRRLTLCGGCWCCRIKDMNEEDTPGRAGGQGPENMALNERNSANFGGSGPPSFASLQWQGGQQQRDRQKYSKVPGIISSLD